MEDNPQTTLKELAADVQHFLNIRQDAALLERLTKTTARRGSSNESKSDGPRCYSTTLSLSSTSTQRISGKGTLFYVSSRHNHLQWRISAESIRTARLIQLVIGYTKSENWLKANRRSPLWYYYNRANTMTTVEGTTQSSFMPKQDENAYKKFGLLAYDGFRHRKTRQDLPKMCIRGKGYGPTTKDDTIYLTWRPTPSGRSSHRISSLHSAVPEESSTFVRRHSIHKGTDKENALCRPSKKDSPGEGCRLQTELDLMLLSRDLTNGARYVKMESQSNRRNGARRRSFKINDAIFAKDYRVRKPTWTLDFITRHTTYTVRAGNEVWTQHAKPVAIQDRHNGE
ncbi:hypothetical protein RB195_006958 [Necator americanus]|uniref:Uncharacterized protein n=1 Tax=Necator americanus TaxID=51031 RepID=A0ABR1BXW6_NECAM